MEKMSAEQAQATLYQKVYVPTFIQKMAAAGIQIRDDEDLGAALETAAMLKLAKKQAAAQGVETNPSPIKDARDLLKEAMFGKEDEQAAIAPQALQDESIKAAASALIPVAPAGDTPADAGTETPAEADTASETPAGDTAAK
jgi:hypothetical protein